MRPTVVFSTLCTFKRLLGQTSVRVLGESSRLMVRDTRLPTGPRNSSAASSRVRFSVVSSPISVKRSSGLMPASEAGELFNAYLHFVQSQSRMRILFDFKHLCRVRRVEYWSSGFSMISQTMISIRSSSRAIGDFVSASKNFVFFNHEDAPSRCPMPTIQRYRAQLPGISFDSDL